MVILLNLVLLALAAGFLIGIFLRFWTMSLEPVLFARVDPPHAIEIVASLLEGVSETRFGFPSGIFRIMEAKSDADRRLTVAEMQPGYSVTDGCAAASTVAGAGILADADGCLEMIIAVTLFAILVIPIWTLNLTEKMFRKLLESEVRADFEQVTDPDGTMVTVRLRGVSALLLKKAYQEALADPVLPDDIAIAAGVTPPPASPAAPTSPEGAAA